MDFMKVVFVRLILRNNINTGIILDIIINDIRVAIDSLVVYIENGLKKKYRGYHSSIIILFPFYK